VPFEVRNRSNFSAKEGIAKQAVSYVHNGDVVFMDASSTVSHMIEYLTPEQNLTVITNSILVAEKMQEKRIRVYLTGGMPVENSYALVGSLAQQAIGNFCANVCFFSAQGISEDGVISDQSEEETALRKEMIRNAKKQYFIFDDSKLGKQFTFKLCQQEEITGVITNCADC
jgi:DeoR/GlpR family transcriptional regulator of sugar metabolism